MKQRSPVGAPNDPSHPVESPSVGRSTITQRHVARLPDAQRDEAHARLDAVWSRPVQLSHDAHTGLDDAQVQSAAAHGLTGSARALPHLDAIQRSFGPHDVSGISAHVGGPARDASNALGAHAYATGNHVAFAEEPSLFLAAHEAAHVVQQRAGVSLSSAVGAAGDSYEHHADAVAARVVAGESAADLLGPVTGGGAGGGGIQRDAKGPRCEVPKPAVCTEKSAASDALFARLLADPYFQFQLQLRYPKVPATPDGLRAVSEKDPRFKMWLQLQGSRFSPSAPGATAPSASAPEICESDPVASTADECSSEGTSSLPDEGQCTMPDDEVERCEDVASPETRKRAAAYIEQWESLALKAKIVLAAYASDQWSKFHDKTAPDIEIRGDHGWLHGVVSNAVGNAVSGAIESFGEKAVKKGITTGIGGLAGFAAGGPIGFVVGVAVESIVGELYNWLVVGDTEGAAHKKGRDDTGKATRSSTAKEFSGLEAAVDLIKGEKGGMLGWLEQASESDALGLIAQLEADTQQDIAKLTGDAMYQALLREWVIQRAADDENPIAGVDEDDFESAIKEGFGLSDGEIKDPAFFCEQTRMHWGVIGLDSSGLAAIAEAARTGAPPSNPTFSFAPVDSARPLEALIGEKFKIGDGVETVSGTMKDYKRKTPIHASVDELVARGLVDLTCEIELDPCWGGATVVSQWIYKISVRDPDGTVVGKATRKITPEKAVTLARPAKAKKGKK